MRIASLNGKNTVRGFGENSNTLDLLHHQSLVASLVISSSSRIEAQYDTLEALIFWRAVTSDHRVWRQGLWELGREIFLKSEIRQSPPLCLRWAILSHFSWDMTILLSTQQLQKAAASSWSGRRNKCPYNEKAVILSQSFIKTNGFQTLSQVPWKISNRVAWTLFQQQNEDYLLEM